MEIRETGADGFVGLKATRFAKKFELGRREGVVGSQLQDPVVEPARISTLEPVDAEMKIKLTLSPNYNVGYGVFL